jgi:hypothetical protein
MKKPANFASVLFIAAALGLWACQHSVPNEKLASLLAQSITSAVR